MQGIPIKTRPLVRPQRWGFPKRLRLLHRVQFDHVFQLPMRVHGQWFLILARASDGSHPRLGMAFSKRVIRTAVSRARLKRVVRESFRLNREDLPNVDIVVLARKGKSLPKDNAALRADLQEMWGRLTALCVK